MKVVFNNIKSFKGIFVKLVQKNLFNVFCCFAFSTLFIASIFSCIIALKNLYLNIFWGHIEVNECIVRLITSTSFALLSYCILDFSQSRLSLKARFYILKLVFKFFNQENGEKSRKISQFDILKGSKSFGDLTGIIFCSIIRSLAIILICLILVASNSLSLFLLNFAIVSFLSVFTFIINQSYFKDSNAARKSLVKCIVNFADSAVSMESVKLHNFKSTNSCYYDHSVNRVLKKSIAVNKNKLYAGLAASFVIMSSISFSVIINHYDFKAVGEPVEWLVSSSIYLVLSSLSCVLLIGYLTEALSLIKFSERILEVVYAGIGARKRKVKLAKDARLEIKIFKNDKMINFDFGVGDRVAIIGGTEDLRENIFKAIMGLSSDADIEVKSVESGKPINHYSLSNFYENAVLMSSICNSYKGGILNNIVNISGKERDEVVNYIKSISSNKSSALIKSIIDQGKKVSHESDCFMIEIISGLIMSQNSFDSFLCCNMMSALSEYNRKFFNDLIMQSSFRSSGARVIMMEQNIKKSDLAKFDLVIDLADL